MTRVMGRGGRLKVRAGCVAAVIVFIAPGCSTEEEMAHQVVPTPPAAMIGLWTITGDTLAPISAVTAAEAAALVGKRVVVAQSEVEFADRHCGGPSFSIKRALDAEHVTIVCKDGAIVPDFLIEQNRVSATLDGVVYSLTKISN